MIKKLTGRIVILLRILKNVLLRPFRAERSRITSSVKGAGTAAFSALTKKLSDMLEIMKKKPENAGDYFDWGSVYVAKKPVILTASALIILPLIYFLWLHPLLTSRFWVKNFYAENEKIAAYSGRVRIYYDEELERLCFEGRLSDGKAVENGTEYYENGQIRYEGEYSGGVFDGSGILYYEDGSVQYRGDFGGGEFNGEGEFSSESGMVYAGNFKSGLLQGSGIMSANGQLLYSGEFVDGVPDGSGKQYYSDGTVRYIGSFSSGVYSGTGTVYGESGIKLYSGGFEAGSYSGGGVLYGSDGSVTEGNFEDGKISGSATRTYRDGTKYEGGFAENLPDGAGTLTNAAGGLIYSGFFSDGDYDYSKILGQPVSSVEDMFPTLTQTVESDCFYLEDSNFGISVRFSFASEASAAMSEEIISKPFEGAVIKPPENVIAPFAISVSESEKILPERYAERFGAAPQDLKCYAAEYENVTVYYWADKFSGELLLRSANVESGNNQSGDNSGVSEGSALSYDEIKALFEEMGLNIEDFESLGFSAAASYDNYSDSAAAEYIKEDHVPLLKETNELFEAERSPELYSERIALFNGFSAEIDLQEAQLSAKLIDYDILLKRLERLLEEYKSYKSAARKYGELYLTGGCQLSDLENAEKSVDESYLNIKALIFEINALKSEIEIITNLPLKSDFDFSRVYLITDALKLTAQELCGVLGADSLCVPEGAERIEYDTLDHTTQLNSAVKNYYALGTALREYVSAAQSVKQGQNDLLIGRLTAEELAVLVSAENSAFMTAAEAKANYAKSLLELDAACGGALTADLGISGGRISALSSAIGERRGGGLWLVSRTQSGTVFSPVILPFPFDSDKDEGSYSVIYNGKQIGGAPLGQACTVHAAEYSDGSEYAEVVFYKNGEAVGIYFADVFSPFGEFIVK